MVAYTVAEFRQLACSDCYILGFFTTTIKYKIMKNELNKLLEKRIFNHEECVSEIEKLAEEQSISFLKWVDKNYYQGEVYNSYGSSLEDFHNKKTFTIEELFKIFKHNAM